MLLLLVRKACFESFLSLIFLLILCADVSMFFLINVVHNELTQYCRHFKRAVRHDFAAMCINARTHLLGQ